MVKKNDKILILSVREEIKSKRDRVRIADILAVLTLFVLSLVFFYDLFEDRFLLTERDLGAYFIPPRFFWVESIKKGDFPLWNPYQFCGQPFFANPQHGILYPFHILFFILPFDIAFNGIIVLHFFLAGLFLFLLLKELKASVTGALISSLVFMLSGYLLSVHSLLSTLLSVVWTPLIFLFFKRAIERRGLKQKVLTALWMTLSFMGGGVEIVYGNFILLVLLILFHLKEERLEVSKYGTFKSLIERFRSLVMVSFFFFVLSAIQLIPFLELWIHSNRGGGISYEEATIWSFAPRDFILFFFPDFFGYFLDIKRYWTNQCWLKTLYTGGLPFILTLIYFLFSRRDREGEKGRMKALFLGIIFVSFFFSLGRYNPLYPFVFKYFPFFHGIRYPVKFLYLFIFALSITSGLGFERLREILRDKSWKFFKSILFLLASLSAFLLLFFVLGHSPIAMFLKFKGIDSPGFNSISTNLYHIKRFFFYLTLFFLLLRIGSEVKWRGWSKGLLMAFLTLDLFGNMGFYGRELTREYFQKTRIQEIMTQDQGFFRVFSTPKTTSLENTILMDSSKPLDFLKEKHLPSLNMLHRIYDMWGVDVIRLKRTDELYRTFIQNPPISSTSLLRLYGVRYVISTSFINEDMDFEFIYGRIEGLQGEKEELLTRNTIKLYRNRKPLPRAWILGNYKVLNSKEILQRLSNPEFNPEEEVILEGTPPFVPKQKKIKGEIRIFSETNRRFRLEVVNEEEGLLVLSDTYYPGWKAFVDGKEEKIFRADYNFRAILIPPGSHLVEFVYDPLSFKLGGWITLLGFLGCFGMIGFEKRKG